MKYIKDRFPIVIIFIMLAISYSGIALLNGPYNQHQNIYRTNKNTAEQSEARPHSPPHFSDMKQTPTANQGRTKEDWQTRDSKAQIQMMRAAWVAVGLTVFGLILVGFTLHYTKKAAKSAADTLIEAKEATKAAWAAVASERAWITTDGMEISSVNNIVNGLESKGIIFRARWKNSGKSPAINIFTKAGISIVPKTTIMRLGTAKINIYPLATNEPGPPNDERKSHCGPDSTFLGPMEYFLWDEIDGVDWLVNDIVLVTYVTYRELFSDEERRTQQVLRVSCNIPWKDLKIMMLDGQDVTQDNFSFGAIGSQNIIN